jgi:GNAT superfamily N-acetyltransferase
MVTIREELPSDIAGREALLDAIFGNARFAKAAERLREDRLPADGLSFVAREGTRVVGTNRLWNIMAGSTRPALLLGPLAVASDRRNRGIGTRLMRRALGEARQLGHRAILLVATHLITAALPSRRRRRVRCGCGARSNNIVYSGANSCRVPSIAPGVLSLAPAARNQHPIWRVWSPPLSATPPLSRPARREAHLFCPGAADINAISASSTCRCKTRTWWGNHIGPGVRHDCLPFVDLRGSTLERDRSQWGLITVGRLCIAAFHDQYPWLHFHSNDFVSRLTTGAGEVSRMIMVHATNMYGNHKNREPPKCLSIWLSCVRLGQVWA